MIRVIGDMGLLTDRTILLEKGNIGSNKCKLNMSRCTLCLNIGDLYVILRRY